MILCNTVRLIQVWSVDIHGVIHGLWKDMSCTTVGLSIRVLACKHVIHGLRVNM